MNGCLDKNLRKMLHHYELGMLDDEDCRRFELHLMECNACFEEVREFRDKALLMKYDADVKETIKTAVEEESHRDAIPDDRISSKEKRRSWRLVPVVALAAAALLFLILKPFQIEIKPDKRAIASENRLAVVYFSNLEEPDDQKRLGEMLTTLVITDLAESEYIHVLSGQRLYDILRLLGKEEIKVISPDLASAVAEKWNARWLLKGSILQTAPVMVVTVQLIEVSSGIAMAAWQVIGEPDESLFSIADRLSADIKERLPLPSAARSEPDRLVTEVTTRSQEAYYYYIKGMEYFEKFSMLKARENFRQALEYDSTFAMAYFRLAIIGDTLQISKAVKYIDQASLKERHYIRSFEAGLKYDYDTAISELLAILERYPEEKEALLYLAHNYRRRGDYRETVKYLELATDIDPLYKIAYNDLAFAYKSLGNFDRALEAVNNYIELAPDEPNPYDSRGYIYAAKGQYKEAIASFEKALEINPHFISSYRQLMLLCLYRRDFDKAASYHQRLMSSASDLREYDMDAFSSVFPTLLMLYQGRLTEALPVLDTLLEEFKKENRLVFLANLYLHKARALYELGRHVEAIETLSQFSEKRHEAATPGGHWFVHYLIQMRAENGELEKAEKLFNELDSVARGSENIKYTVSYARGAIELAKGRLDAAIAAFQSTTEEACWMAGNYMLGQAYLAAGRNEEAISAWEWVLSDMSQFRADWPIWDVKTHYFLGLAYERNGETRKASEQYRIFLDAWKKADPELAEPSDARARLDRLQSEL